MQVLIVTQKVLIRIVILAILEKTLFLSIFRSRCSKKPLFHGGYRPIQTGKQQTI